MLPKGEFRGRETIGTGQDVVPHLDFLRRRLKEEDKGVGQADDESEPADEEDLGWRWKMWRRWRREQ